MTSTRSSFESELAERPTILATLGQLDDSHFVVTAAIRFGCAMPRAYVHVVHVLPDAVRLESGVARSLIHALARERLTSCAERMTAALHRHVDAHLELGRPASAISALAARLNADFLVIGATDGRPVRRALFGSVADELLRGAPCSVVLARPPGG